MEWNRYGLHRITQSTMSKHCRKEKPKVIFKTSGTGVMYNLPLAFPCFWEALKENSEVWILKGHWYVSSQRTEDMRCFPAGCMACWQGNHGCAVPAQFQAFVAAAVGPEQRFPLWASAPSPVWAARARGLCSNTAHTTVSEQHMASWQTLLKIRPFSPYF